MVIVLETTSSCEQVNENNRGNMEATTNLTAWLLLCPAANPLCLHKNLVPYMLSILLRQTAFFRPSTRTIIQQLGLVKRLP